MKILITGAAGQIGTEAARVLSVDNDIVGLDLCIPKDSSCFTSFEEIDVTDSLKLESIFKKHCPDALINNVGISIFSNFEDRTHEEIQKVVGINLESTINCIRYFAKHSSKSDNKNIVNVGSLYGFISPDPRIYTDCSRNSPEIYGATKAGVIQLTKYFCVHLASKQIRVNAVSPGGVYNENNPQGDDFIKNYSFRCPMSRMANALEIANAIKFLISKEASYINGHNLVVDGGFSAW